MSFVASGTPVKWVGQNTGVDKHQCHGLLEKPKNEELERHVGAVIEENATKLKESLRRFLATVDQKRDAVGSQGRE